MTTYPRLPAYVERDHAPVRGLEGEPALLLTSLYRIERHYLRALHFSYGSRANLREALRRLAIRLHAFGVPRDKGHRLIRMLTVHCSEGANRPSLLRGPSTETAIHDFMLDCFDRAFDAAAVSGSS